jgi:heat shock protein HslJ
MIRSLILVAFGVTACQADETISGYADPNATYQLTDLNGAAPKTEITINFPENGQLAGKASCNSYFGSQTKPLPWFETGPIASTKMACPFLEEETEYFQTLAGATLAEINQNTIILSNDTGPVLTYKRQ